MDSLSTHMSIKKEYQHPTDIAPRSTTNASYLSMQVEDYISGPLPVHLAPVFVRMSPW